MTHGRMEACLLGCLFLSSGVAAAREHAGISQPSRAFLVMSAFRSFGSKACRSELPAAIHIVEALRVLI